MSLASPPLNGQINALADWVEFKVLISEYKNFYLSELLRLVDEEQNEENPDTAELESEGEQLYESVLEELNHRQKCLFSAYPFILNDTSTELMLCEELTKGGYIYLYCLFFSHINREEVLVIDPPSSQSDRDLMQVCSTFAAAGIIEGNSISFGFPRSDRSNFIEALDRVYESFGEVNTHKEIPAGAPQRVKDAGIDIIAWKKHADDAPGHPYLLGQVASGADWTGKTVLNDIVLFHDTWFLQAPTSEPTAGMFIPFCIDNQKGITIDETLGYLTKKFGHVFYRYRLPKYAEDGLLLSENDTTDQYKIDRVEDYSKIQTYVNDFLNTLRVD